MNAKFSQVAIRSMGYILPPKIVSSQDIEGRLTGSRFPIPKGTIENVTGVKKRRFWEGNYTTSQICTLASNEALAKAEIDRSKVEMLVRGSVERHLDEPADACSIHHALGLSPHCEPHDVLNACIGFLTAMTHVAFAIETGAIRYGLVVAGENAGPCVEQTIERLKSQSINYDEIQESLTNFTLGAGAIAMLLCHKDEFPQGPRIKYIGTFSATQHHELCLGRGYQIRTKAKQLMDATNLTIPEAWKVARDKCPDWNIEDIDIVIPHQVSKMNIDLPLKSLGIEAKKIIRTYPFLGNVASVSVPISLALALRKGYIKKNSHVALLGAGSGLNLLGMSIRFGEEIDLVNPSDPISLEDIPPLIEEY